jgi:hypothetical protein
MCLFQFPPFYLQQHFHISILFITKFLRINFVDSGRSYLLLPTPLYMLNPLHYKNAFSRPLLTSSLQIQFLIVILVLVDISEDFTQLTIPSFVHLTYDLYFLLVLSFLSDCLFLLPLHFLKF